jgi:hypothetical protein
MTPSMLTNVELMILPIAALQVPARRAGPSNAIVPGLRADLSILANPIDGLSTAACRRIALSCLSVL